MKFYNKILTYFGAAVLAAAAGCTADEPALPDTSLERGEYTYTLNLDLGLDSRATALEYDGAVVSLVFHPGEEINDYPIRYIAGFAVYSASDNKWTVQTYYSLGDDDYGFVDIYYFGPDTGYAYAEEFFEINCWNPIYTTKQIYSINKDGEVEISGTLMPRDTRIRFSSEEYFGSMSFYGMQYPVYYNSQDSDPINYNVGQISLTANYEGLESKYCTPYITIAPKGGNIYGKYFKVHSPDWDSSRSVRLFDYTDKPFKEGATYTIPADNVDCAAGPYNYWYGTNYYYYYTNQTEPGSWAYHTILSTVHSNTGIRAVLNVKVNGYAVDEKYSGRIGLMFETYTSATADNPKRFIVSFGTGRGLEVGETYTIDYSYYDPNIGTAEDAYYNVAFLYDGVNAYTSNIYFYTF